MRTRHILKKLFQEFGPNFFDASSIRILQRSISCFCRTLVPYVWRIPLDPYPGTSRAVPCRAQIWWIRAVPNISVPCPHDPVPCQIFPCRAPMIRAQIWWIRAVRLRRASRNMGPFLWEKKAPAATYPQAKGFQKYGALFGGRKKRLRQRTHKLRASRNLAPLGFRPKNKVFERPG